MQSSSDVIIVGAGPTGLTLATALAVRGVTATVLDRQAQGANTSRAAVVHAHTLESLESLGVVDRLIARGIRTSRFTIRDRDRVLVPVRFDDLPTRYPYTLMISQAVTEAVLLRRLTELGGDVAWQRRVADVTQDGQGVTARMDDGTHLRARYLVGADGMHSTVREQSGIGFPGGDYGESFSLADVRLTGGDLRDEVVLYFSPMGLLVVAPLPDGVHRIVATVDSAPEQPNVDDVQALLDARGPERKKVIVEEVLWGSRFHVHHRIANTFRCGRILLAGDAAHVHSPAGGQGMNVGIQDAVALAEALGDAIAGNNDEALGTYDATRRPVAQQVIVLTDRLTRLATVSWQFRFLRNTLLRLLSYSPAFRHNLASHLSGLVYRRG